jgi:hypothetical protein
MTNERTSNLRFVALMTAAGLFSGVLTAGLSQVYFGYLSSPAFGVIIACVLAISGIARKMWKAICVVALTTAAFWISYALAAGIELHVPREHWAAMGKYPTVSPASLAAGGMIGAFIVLTTTLLLIDRKAALAGLLWRSLCWSLLAGSLAVLGWTFGPTLGQLLVPQQAPSKYARKAAPFEDTPEHHYALYVVWQTGMAFALGMVLKGYRPKPGSEELKLI